MKNISQFISESVDFELLREYKYFKGADFFYFNPDNQVYGFMSNKDIENWEDEFGEDRSVIDEVLNLKPGECWSNDSMNYYVRINK